MEELGIILKPWVFGIGVSLLITGVIFIAAPSVAIALSRALDRSLDIERFAKSLEAKVFNIDRWIVKNIKWLGVIALSDAVILLVMHYIYLR